MAEVYSSAGRSTGLTEETLNLSMAGKQPPSCDGDVSWFRYDDLVLHEAHWSHMTAEQKSCANAGSFTVPVLLAHVKGTLNQPSKRGFCHQNYTDKGHVARLLKNMTDDGRAVLVFQARIFEGFIHIRAHW